MPTRTPDGGFTVLDPSRDVVDEWDRMAVATAASPFARPGWCLAWAEAFGHPLRVAAVHRDGTLAALLPIVPGRRRIRTAADWHVPYTEAVAWDDADLAALFDGLASLGRLAVDFVVEGSATERVAAAALAGRPSRRILRLRSPFLDTSRSFDGYCDQLDSKKLRELRRRRRRLEEAHGEVRYEVVDGAGDWEDALVEGIAIEASGWKGDEGTAVASDDAIEGFYRSLTAWAASAKLLEIGLLRAGSRAVAFDLALADGTSTWLLKTGYDEAFARFGPGSQLRFEAIRRAFELGLSRYEFTGEVEPWKDEWTATRRRIVLVEAFEPGLRGSVALLATRLGRAVRVQGRRALARLR